VKSAITYSLLNAVRNKTLDVLHCGRQKELLPHELESPQAQATESDLTLQFGKPRFHLFSLSLDPGKLQRVG
jgi:hypothetical protein